jgi:FkbM family methyltransferase
MTHLAALCPDARIVGVELDGENVRLARRNVARWGDRCKVIVGAAWVRHEPVRYRRAAREECGAALAAVGDREVRGLALEALLAEMGWNSVDYVKMDIEGTERAVLRENTGWASRVRSIKVETHAGYTRAECSADLERLGFTASVDLRHPAAVEGVRDV